MLVLKLAPSSILTSKRPLWPTGYTLAVAVSAHLRMQVMLQMEGIVIVLRLAPSSIWTGKRPLWSTGYTLAAAVSAHLRMQVMLQMEGIVIVLRLATVVHQVSLQVTGERPGERPLWSTGYTLAAVVSAHLRMLNLTYCALCACTQSPTKSLHTGLLSVHRQWKPDRTTTAPRCSYQPSADTEQDNQLGSIHQTGLNCCCQM